MNSVENSLSEARFWDANAPGRDKWRGRLEETLGPMSSRLVELARVQSEHSVLDVGTGTGEPALTAARKVGPRGRVVGTDFSEAMIDVARQRTALNDTGAAVEFRMMEACNLDFREASFDAVLCQLVLMFLPDPLLALQGMRRLLRPGGRLAAAVLGPPPRTPSVMIWQKALAGEASSASVPSRGMVPTEEVNPFRFANLQELARALQEAGFVDVYTETLATDHTFESPDEFVVFQLDMDPEFKSQLSINGLSRILDGVRRDLEPYIDGFGRVRLSHVYNLACAAAP